MNLNVLRSPDYDHTPPDLKATFRTIFPKCYKRGVIWVGKYTGQDDLRGKLFLRSEQPIPARSNGVQQFMFAKTMSGSSA